jgi:hypothetical protein
MRPPYNNHERKPSLHQENKAIQAEGEHGTLGFSVEEVA